MEAFIVIAAIVGVVVGLAVMFFVTKTREKSSANEASNMRQKAETEAKALVENAKKQADTYRKEAEIEAKDQALRYKQQIEE